MKILQVSIFQYVSLKLGGCICNSQRLCLLISFLLIVIPATLLLSPNFFPQRISINTLPWPWKNLRTPTASGYHFQQRARMTSDPYFQSDKRWGEKKFDNRTKGFDPPNYPLDLLDPGNLRCISPSNQGDASWGFPEGYSFDLSEKSQVLQKVWLFGDRLSEASGLAAISSPKKHPTSSEKKTVHINPQLLEVFDETLLFSCRQKGAPKNPAPKRFFQLFNNGELIKKSCWHEMVWDGRNGWVDCLFSYHHFFSTDFFKWHHKHLAKQLSPGGEGSQVGLQRGGGVEVRGDLRCWKEIKEMSLKNSRLGITARHRFESPRFGLMFQTARERTWQVG